MRSRTVIIGDERQEDFDRLAAGWRAEFDFDGQAAESLLGRVILEDWFLRRAEGVCMEAQAEFESESRTTGTNALKRRRPVRSETEVHPLEWSEEQHAQMQLYLRYKTTAERSFYRAYYALRGLRKDKIREELDVSKLREKMDEYAVEAVEKASVERQERQPAAQATKRIEAKRADGAVESRGKALDLIDRAQRAPTARCARLFQGQNAPKKMRKVAVLDQWIEVEIQDGKTVTKLYPSNGGLIKEGQAMDPPPDLVYRRLNFPHGVPEEYRWAAGSKAARLERGGMGTQRMTVETWLEVIEREEASGTGHVGPTGVGNLPRPKERGGCDCEVCTHNRAALERRAG